MISPKSRKHLRQSMRSYLRMRPIWQWHLLQARLSRPYLRGWVLHWELGICVVKININILTKTALIYIITTAHASTASTTPSLPSSLPPPAFSASLRLNWPPVAPCLSSAATAQQYPQLLQHCSVDFPVFASAAPQYIRRQCCDFQVRLTELSASSSDFWEMQKGIFLDWRFWLFLGEAVFVVLWIRYCSKCYKEYRA